MSELDGVYRRLKTQWLELPEKLERDEPLLARAFAEAQPNRDLEAAFEQAKRDHDRGLGETAHALQRLEGERDAALDELQVVRTQRLTENRAHAAAEARLEGRIAALERQLAPTVEPTIDQDEAGQLAALGWRKS
jgi:predicted  nucleic acid-binding Zn-ribbon protein